MKKKIVFEMSSLSEDLLHSLASTTIYNSHFILKTLGQRALDDMRCLMIRLITHQPPEDSSTGRLVEAMDLLMDCCCDDFSTPSDYYQRVCEDISSFVVPSVLEDFPDYPSLKSRLLTLINLNAKAAFSDIVLNELPHVARFMPRREWEALLEWVFLSSIECMKDDDMIFHTGRSNFSPCVKQRLKLSEFRSRMECMRCFVELTKVFEEFKQPDRRMLSTRSEIEIAMHFHRFDVWRLNRILTSTCTFCIDTDDLHFEEVFGRPSPSKTAIQFLYYETVRVAMEIRRRNDAMGAVSMALHGRLGAESFMGALQPELIQKIFVFL